MYRKEENGTATSMFRGRPLQGKIYNDANFYLMKEDKLNEDALKTAAKVTSFTNWIVQVLYLLPTTRTPELIVLSSQ